MPLHLSYRPKTLEEFFGNRDLKEALLSVLNPERGDRPRVLLFAGERGCGKTSLARIVRNMVGCDESWDFWELNIGDTRGIDEARRLAERVHCHPAVSDIKIYVLDECQNATSQFFECLLKPLEDTPSHTMFILCTTEPEKLKKTVLSRCTRFDVAPLHATEIRRLLRFVLDREGVADFPEDAIQKISEVCQGIPRDALVLLDKVIDITDDGLILETIEKEIVEEVSIKNLCQALLNKRPWNEVKAILKGLKDEQPEKVRLAILGYCTKVLLDKGDLRSALIIDSFKNPFYDSKFAGLTLAAYEVTIEE